MSFDDWNKYFKEVFQGAWDCYSQSCDSPYRQWIEKGARWSLDFQNQVLCENKQIKQENHQLKELLREACDVIDSWETLNLHVLCREFLDKPEIKRITR